MYQDNKINSPLHRCNDERISHFVSSNSSKLSSNKILIEIDFEMNVEIKINQFKLTIILFGDKPS